MADSRAPLSLSHPTASHTPTIPIGAHHQHTRAHVSLHSASRWHLTVFTLASVVLQQKYCCYFARRFQIVSQESISYWLYQLHHLPLPTERSSQITTSAILALLVGDVWTGLALLLLLVECNYVFNVPPDCSVLAAESVMMTNNSP